MENKEINNNGVYSHKVRAGKRRTYFFDVRTTKYDDYYIILTESKRRYNQDGYEKHKIFLYKEDFNKFQEGLAKVIDHVKTELMPDFDFDAFDNRDNDFKSNNNNNSTDAVSAEEVVESPNEETPTEESADTNSVDETAD